MAKKVRRSSNKKLFGVCGGIAEYMDADPTIVRIAFVAFVLLGGSGLLLYLLAAILMPAPNALTGNEPGQLPPGP